MKKLSNLFSIVLIAMLGAALSFSACSEDDDEETNNDSSPSAEGTVTLGTGDEYSLSQGVLQLNDTDTVNTYTLLLGSAGLDYSNLSGSGDVVSLTLFSTQNPLTSGDFTVAATPGNNIILGEGSFFAIGVQLPSQISEKSYGFVPNSMTEEDDSFSFSKDGDSYTITGSFPMIADTAQNHTSLELTYSGGLQYDDVTDQ